MMTPASQGGSPLEQLEHELGVLLRRARGVSGSIARSVHPQVDAAAYGLMARIHELGSSRITDLAEFFSVGKPTVSRQVADLEQAGLVERNTNTEDGRSRHVSLTDDGREVLALAREARRARIRDQLAGWATAEVEQFAALLQRYNSIL